MVRLAVCACDLRHACATVPVAGAAAPGRVGDGAENDVLPGC